MTSGESELRYGSCGCRSSAAMSREMKPIPVCAAARQPCLQTHDEARSTESRWLLRVEDGRTLTRHRAVTALGLNLELDIQVSLLADGGSGVELLVRDALRTVTSRLT